MLLSKSGLYSDNLRRNSKNIKIVLFHRLDSICYGTKYFYKITIVAALLYANLLNIDFKIFL